MPEARDAAADGERESPGRGRAVSVEKIYLRAFLYVALAWSATAGMRAIRGNEPAAPFGITAVVAPAGPACSPGDVRDNLEKN